jgi:hypothetical protein
MGRTGVEGKKGLREIELKIRERIDKGVEIVID